MEHLVCLLWHEEGLKSLLIMKERDVNPFLPGDIGKGLLTSF